MNTTLAHQAYSQNNVNINSQEKLVLMLYEGILRFTTFAKKAMESSDIEKKAYWINRTIDIFSELSSSLDMKAGGETAEYLEGLYNHQIIILTRANLDNEIEHLDTVIRVTRGLIEAWKEVTQLDMD
jgi:flagellar protein FliS